MVTKRKRIGILFNYTEGWIGGTYYFINLVYALKELDDNDKPNVVIISESEDSLNIIKKTGYPYLSYLNSKFHYSILERIINKLSRSVFEKNIIRKTISYDAVDLLFGSYDQIFQFEKSKRLYWIPDLQEKYYPEYFDPALVASRKANHEKLAYSKSSVLFSSIDAKNDFEKFYPDFICENYVANFAVTLPDLDNSGFEKLSAKYNILTPYYFSPNQFWLHKNHLTVIKAIEILKKNGIDITVIFTGNEDTGGGVYANELKDYVRENNLEINCLFLGFIDREEQLILMNNAKAVLQPSLFEGWSTVIEDAKCMGKYLIVSDLKVHYEQLKNNASFFSRNQPEQLAILLRDFESFSYTPHKLDYKKDVIAFGENFLKIANLV